MKSRISLVKRRAIEDMADRPQLLRIDPVLAAIPDDTDHLPRAERHLHDRARLDRHALGHRHRNKASAQAWERAPAPCGWPAASRTAFQRDRTNLCSSGETMPGTAQKGNLRRRLAHRSYIVLVDRSPVSRMPSIQVAPSCRITWRGARTAPLAHGLRQRFRMGDDPDLAALRRVRDHVGQRRQHIRMQACLRFVQRNQRRQPIGHQRRRKAEETNLSVRQFTRLKHPVREIREGTGRTAPSLPAAARRAAHRRGPLRSARSRSTVSWRVWTSVAKTAAILVPSSSSIGAGHGKAGRAQRREPIRAETVKETPAIDRRGGRSPISG